MGPFSKSRVKSSKPRKKKQLFLKAHISRGYSYFMILFGNYRFGGLTYGNLYILPSFYRENQPFMDWYIYRIRLVTRSVDPNYGFFCMGKMSIPMGPGKQ